VPIDVTSSNNASQKVSVSFENGFDRTRRVTRTVAISFGVSKVKKRKKETEKIHFEFDRV